jgi:hypothetical protein
MSMSGAAGTYVLIEDDGVTERFRTQNEKRSTAFSYSRTGWQTDLE